MNEEIEYAEMLEIPVSTVNVLKKQSKKRKASAKEAGAFAKREARSPLKDSLIEQVNGRLANDLSTSEQNAYAQAQMQSQAPQATQETPMAQEGEPPFQGLINYGEGAPDEADGITDRIDTVRLLSSANKRKRVGSFAYSDAWNSSTISPEEMDEDVAFLQNDGGRVEDKTPSRGTSALLRIEFALACLLSAGIFLTNVLMPNSAINTFFASLKQSETSAADLRPYDEFTLSGVLSARSDAEIALSDAGVLTVTGESMIYPVADGTVAEIAQAADGTYVVKISHSDTFTGIVDGLNEVFYSVGDDVKGNVPMGYTKGEKEVQVTMYSEGELLNCFEITEDDRLVWVENVQAE